MMRALPLALAAAAVAATVSLACGQDEEVVTPDATVAPASEPAPTAGWTASSGTPVPKPGWKTARLLNLTVSVPDGIMASPLAGYTFSPTDYYNRPVIEIAPVGGSDSVRVVFDAETGALVAEAGSEGERAALQPALDTVRVSPFDPKTAPWPYADTAPPNERGGWGSITYPLPDPLSGIGIGMGVGDGGPPSDCNSTIFVGNGRSRMVINACTGQPAPNLVSVDPEDAAAFDRFLKAIELKP